MVPETEIDVFEKSNYENAFKTKDKTIKIKVGDIVSAKRGISIVGFAGGLGGLYVVTKNGSEYVLGLSLFEFNKYIKELRAANSNIQDLGTKFIGLRFIVALFALVLLGAVAHFWLAIW